VTPRVETAVTHIIAELKSWDEVEAVTLLTSGDDIYDPYYFLSLDVYTTAPVRQGVDRSSAYGAVSAFESSVLTHKDRFMVGELPFRVEYKLVDRFSDLIAAAETGKPGLRNAGTYAFFRLLSAESLFARTGWLADLQSRLSNLPDGFWIALRKNLQDSAEHTYADLRAAAVRNDPLYFIVSAGRFVSTLSSLLFAVNRQFEPSPRQLQDALADLPILPDSFPANLENFIDQNSLSMSQRAELAELMITAVISLYATNA
jgi:hypothetical protein